MVYTNVNVDHSYLLVSLINIHSFQEVNPLLHNSAFWCLLNIIYLKILLEKEHLLHALWSKCSIFHNYFISIQNFTLTIVDFFQFCLKIENDVRI